ncbi:MAG: hypothetical protein AUJ04_00210 [Acidobacteria bacterium 13_1_40CM_3_55_6]|nr:MAG: hypothetical protein AUJ04_00210 [Acidobacteria bacterium 13_1_40CM_3_55_6]
MTLNADLIALKLDIRGRSSRMPALTGTGLVEYFRTHTEDQQANYHDHQTQNSPYHSSWRAVSEPRVVATGSYRARLIDPVGTARGSDTWALASHF